MRIRIVLLSFFVFILSGCAREEPPVPECEFSASAVISVNDSLSNRSEFQAQVTSAAQGVLSVTLTSPAELAGLCYKWGEGFELIYNDLHLQTEGNYLPEFCFAQVLHNVLCDLSKNTVCEKCEGDTAVFRGNCESGAYTVVTDSKGYIQNISVEEINLKMEFSYRK